MLCFCVIILCQTSIEDKKEHNQSQVKTISCCILVKMLLWLYHIILAGFCIISRSWSLRWAIRTTIVFHVDLKITHRLLIHDIQKVFSPELVLCGRFLIAIIAWIARMNFFPTQCYKRTSATLPCWILSWPSSKDLSWKLAVCRLLSPWRRDFLHKTFCISLPHRQDLYAYSLFQQNPNNISKQLTLSCQELVVFDFWLFIFGLFSLWCQTILAILLKLSC